MSWRDEQPCQCHGNHAAVAPFHRGHCCFWPATQTCHPVQVAAWRQVQDRVHGAVPDTTTKPEEG